MNRVVLSILALLVSETALAACDFTVCPAVGSCDFATVNDAMAYAEPGCTIQVMEDVQESYGTYVGLSDVTVLGNPTASPQVTIDAQNLWNPLFYVEGSGFRVENLQIKLGNAQAVYVELSAQVTLDGVIIDGAGQYQTEGLAAGHALVRPYASLSITNSTLKYGYSAGAGSVGVESYGDLYVSDSSFEGNYSVNGGAILVSTDAGATIERTSFSSNSSSGEGGALSSDPGSYVSVSSSEFYANSASFGGAAMFQGEFDSSDTSYDGNYATVGGGALYGDGAYLSSEYDEFTSNQAPAGGAIGLRNGASGSVSGGSFSYNYAVDYGNTQDSGGAIAMEDASLVASVSEFTYNVATDNGGALYWVDSTVELYGVTGTDNSTSSTSYGGFAQGDDSYGLTVQDGVFLRNTGGKAGGAFALRGATLRSPGPVATFLRNRFCANAPSDTAGLWGGALFVSQTGASVSIVNNLFVENSAPTEGGAVHLSQTSGDSTVRFNHFLGNDSSSGAAIYQRNSPLFFEANLLAHNQTGSGVTLGSSATATIQYSAFYDNGPFGGSHFTGTLDESNLVGVDPLLMDYDESHFGNDCSENTYKLLAGKHVSPLVDFVPTEIEADATFSDVGGLGGASLAAWAFDDVDEDGTPLRYDCDDEDPEIHPWADEICDGIDNDCDWDVDELDDDALTTAWVEDADGDGYPTDEGAGLYACTDPSGTNGSTWYDEDLVEDFDCNDGNPDISPSATEECGGPDDDCDGLKDEDDPDLDWNTADIYYYDVDNDGHAGSWNVQACSQPEDTWTTWDDCNDEDDDVYPGQDEVCDGYDNDCDDLVDDDDDVSATSGSLWYYDGDGDAYGDDEHETVWACDTPGDDWVQSGGDCDDGRQAVHPGVTEVCDEGVDNDCSGDADDDDLAVDEGTFSAWYRDNDDDGYGAEEATAVLACEAPHGYVSDHTDCDDEVEYVAPGTPELCDGDDNDCDGQIDENLTEETWYADSDGDGHGDAGVTKEKCEKPKGYVDSSDDCNDEDDTVFPGALDSECAAIDSDCDGEGGRAYDGDGDDLTYDEEETKGSDPCVADTDGDGIRDDAEVDGDSDEDGEANVVDADDDGDTIPTSVEGTEDSDGDDVPDYLDTDSDDDGSADGAEGTGDFDGDGIPNYLDNGTAVVGGEEEEPVDTTPPEHDQLGFGFGCSTAPGRSMAWLLLLLPMGYRRRR